MRTVWCGNRSAFIKPLPPRQRGCGDELAEGTGADLCAALEPIVRHCSPPHRSWNSLTLLPPPADFGLDGRAWRLAADRTGTCQFRLRCCALGVRVQTPRGLALLQRAWSRTRPGRCRICPHWKRCWAGGCTSRPASWKILYLPLRLLFAVCAGAQAPAAVQSFLPTRAVPPDALRCKWR